jgi:hypothetical protein
MDKLLSDRDAAVWTFADDLVEEGKHAVEHDDPAVMEKFFQYVQARLEAVPPNYRPKWESIYQDLYLHASVIGSRKALAWLKSTHDQHFNRETQDLRTVELYKHANSAAFRDTGKPWRIQAHGPWTPPRPVADGRKRPHQQASSSAAANQTKRIKASPLNATARKLK